MSSQNFKSSYFIYSLLLAGFTVFLLINHMHRSLQNKDRGIASDNLENLPLELTAAEANQLVRDIKTRIIQNLEINSSTTDLEIKLGAFVTKNQNGDIVTICDLYPQIFIQLVADGIFLNGDPVIFETLLPCVYETGSDYIQSFNIQKNQLEESVEGDIPSAWYLGKIRLESDSNPLEISSYEVNYVKGGPFTFNIEK